MSHHKPRQAARQSKSSRICIGLIFVAILILGIILRDKKEVVTTTVAAAIAGLFHRFFGEAI